jgi:ADP-ribosylglycohydrolase
MLDRNDASFKPLANIVLATVVAVAIVAAAAGINHVWPIFGAYSEPQMPRDYVTRDEAVNFASKADLEALQTKVNGCATQAQLAAFYKEANDLAEIMGEVTQAVARPLYGTPDYRGLVGQCMNAGGSTGLLASMAQGLCAGASGSQ